MDSNSKQLCRVCLEESDDFINIFGHFEDATIASILVEHFWFQVRKNDGMTEWLCQICWINIKTFHIFYNRIEFLHAKFNSTDLDSGDLKTEEQSVSAREGAFEFDLNIVKCEETKLTEVVFVRDDKNDCDDNNDCDEVGENSQTFDDEDQFPNDKPKNDAVREINAAKKASTANIKPKNSNNYSRSEIDEQNARIRQFFNMKCEICSDVEFDTLLQARQHYRKVHNTDGYIVCCQRKFHRRREILDHILRHVDPGAYRCDQCGKCFINKYSLRNHIDIHVPIDSRAHKCALCSSSFTKASVLKNHVERKHSPKTYTCDECNKKFRSKHSLKHHLQFIHKPSTNQVCEICARQFRTVGALRYHIDRQHLSKPIPKMQCNICGARFITKKGYIKHMKRVHGPQDDFVNCPICSKLVNGKNSLSAHISYVHAERNHRCVLCDKAFKSAIILKEHIASHTGEDLYDCTFCEKKFKSNANMYSHRKKAHLEEWTQYMEKKRME